MNLTGVFMTPAVYMAHHLFPLHKNPGGTFLLKVPEEMSSKDAVTRLAFLRFLGISIFLIAFS